MAHFLATLHNRTAGDWKVNHDEIHDYAGQLIHSLVTQWGMSPADSGELYFRRDQWRAQSCMWEDRAVLVHGDATPANFLFSRGRHTMAIDFERMKWTDRVFDLGRLCGELKHFFSYLWATTCFGMCTEPNSLASERCFSRPTRGGNRRKV